MQPRPQNPLKNHVSMFQSTKPANKTLIDATPRPQNCQEPRFDSLKYQTHKLPLINTTPRPQNPQVPQASPYQNHTSTSRSSSKKNHASNLPNTKPREHAPISSTRLDLEILSRATPGGARGPAPGSLDL
ncbi:hypothetical protein KM043_001149 [Ampulex compressa]|nr:hypothetical protein KM043_001149 [Ampulex compressa]